MMYQLCNIADGRSQVDTVGNAAGGVAAGDLPEQAALVVRDWTDTTLGERVRYLAQAKGVSISRLGEQAGLNRTAIHRMAKDTSPEVKRFAGTIDKLARTWGVSSEWLFYGRGDPDRPASTPRSDDPFPHRAEACRIALDGGIEPEAVREVAELSVDEVRSLLAKHPGQPSDASILWWLHQIERRGVRLREPANATKGAR
jgi:transcriptional regulator with XRE-family HTH domain